MCGISGIMMRGEAPVSTDRLDVMGRALAHRGPDGYGHYVRGPIGFRHERLAIIDLATGDQPLFAGPAALVANGEVYNYRELREVNQLRCATASDCEPPLHLWRRDGIGFAEGLRGMYAIALQDRIVATGGSRMMELTNDLALMLNDLGRYREAVEVLLPAFVDADGGPLARELDRGWDAFGATLPTLALRVLAVHGGNDPIAPVGALRAYAEQIEALSLVEMPGGGHDILNDVSHREVAAHVVEFIHSSCAQCG